MDEPPSYNTVQPHSTGPQASTGGTAQQPTGPQQPIQSAGPGQAFLPLQAYPQPIYYVGSPYPLPGCIPDPMRVVYPQQQYITLPRPSGAVLYPTGQQPMAIQQQPITVPSTTVVRPSSGDNYLTLSVVMTFLVLILGGWPSLLCSICALLISSNARDDERRGNIAASRSKANISLGLNVAAVVFTIMVWSVVAIPVAVTVSAEKSTSVTVAPTSCYSYYCYNAYCSYSPYSCSYYSYYTYYNAYTSSYYNYYYSYSSYYTSCSANCY